MFILEDYFLNRKDKIKAWEDHRERWLKEDEHGWRDRSQFEREHPYPVADLGFIARWVALIAIVLFIVGTAIALIMNHESKPKEEKKETATVQQAENGTKCGHKFKINDHVRIQYGTYVDKIGRIIGGCDGTEEYQVKLDDKQTINGAYNEDTSQYHKEDVSGRIIGVDNDNNLVVIP